MNITPDTTNCYLVALTRGQANVIYLTSVETNNLRERISLITNMPVEIDTCALPV